MIRHAWKFRILLVALLALMAIHPLMHGHGLARLGYTVAWTLVQLATIFAIAEIKWHRYLGWGLSGMVLCGIWAAYLRSDAGGDSSEIVAFGLGAIFFGVVAIMVMRHLVTHEVTADNVAGAVCAYLFLGLGIGLVYAIVETLQEHSFQATGSLAAELADPVQRRATLTYFSFITLTTAGFGDITPATPLTRTLAALEALLGQFYLAILVAGLVGIRANRRGDGSLQDWLK